MSKQVVEMKSWRICPYSQELYGLIHYHPVFGKLDPSGEHVTTSHIKSVNVSDDNSLYVETNNTIYLCLGDSVVEGLPPNLYEDLKEFARKHNVSVDRLYGKHG